MTQRGRGWFERLAGDSLRSQYRLAVVVVLGSLVLTSVVSALSVVWANDVLQEQSDRATSLKGVNSSIRLDMADAETSLRGFGISGRRSALEMYLFAMSWLPRFVSPNKLDLLTPHLKPMPRIGSPTAHGSAF